MEVVVFALNPGVTSAELLETNEAVERWARTRPGFLSKELSYVADQDKWIDIVRWESMEAAHAAAAAAMSSDSCAPMFELIDMGSTLMLHGEPKAHAAMGAAV